MQYITKKYLITLSVIFTAVFVLTGVAQAIAQPSTPLPRDENRVPMQNTYMNAIVSGRKTITTPGTAEALIGTTRPNCKYLTISALTTNTNIVAVGGSTTLATVGSEKGILLNAGDSFSLGISDCNDIYVDAITASEGVSFVYQE